MRQKQSQKGQMESNGEMVEILEKNGLSASQINLFKEHKISPDIVTYLSLYEFQCLGVTDRNDIMKLRLACVTYGRPKNAERNGRFDIPKLTLESLLESGFSIADVSQILCVSESTLYRKMRQYNISKLVFTDVSNNQLDTVVAEMLTEFPHCGEAMLRKLLNEKGIKVIIIHFTIIET